MIFNHVEVANRHYDQNRSIIIAGGHYNNWELFAVGVADAMKHKAVAFYKPLTNLFFDAKMRQTRSKYGLEMVSTKLANEVFEQNKKTLTATIFGVDQSPAYADKCYWTTFLNQDTGVQFGAEKFAREFDMPVIYGRINKIRRGYYSFDLGVWHIVALNTNCDAPGVGGCGAGSEQEKWLKADLAAHANSCVAAFGHHALYSSGLLKRHAVHPELRDLWRDLYASHAALMMAGHEHSYERFAPQDPDGHADPQNGMREIVVGTGGRSHDPLGLALPQSEVRNADTFGVLKLTLSPGKYQWEFLPVNGEEGFHDAGDGICRSAKSAN